MVLAGWRLPMPDVLLLKMQLARDEDMERVLPARVALNTPFEVLRDLNLPTKFRP